MNDADKIIASAAKATLSPKEFNSIADKMSPSEVESWLRELVSRGHGSPLEHSIYVFEVICSRVCSHQLVRHRHASYSQLSQRYSDKYLKSLIIKVAELVGVDPAALNEKRVVPQLIRELLKAHNSFETLLSIACEAFIIPPKVLEERDARFLARLLEGVASYYEALDSGLSFEDARYLLPQAVKTRVVVSMNARELVEVFLPLRMCSRAQWEIRYVAWSLWKQLIEVHPAIFKYTGPRCVFFENRVRTKPCALEDFLSKACTFTIEKCPEGVPRTEIPRCIGNSSESRFEEVLTNSKQLIA